MSITQVFRCPEASKQGIESWMLMLDGKLLLHDWNSKGAATAAIAVERGRQARKANL